jgi:hypothetical protein
MATLADLLDVSEPEATQLLADLAAAGCIVSGTGPVQRRLELDARIG